MKTKCRQLTSMLIITPLALLGSTKQVVADELQTVGDLLQFVLPAAAAGMTLGYRDGEGAIQLAESVALTMGTAYALKYTIDAKRPNGSNHSFPSGHAALSFSAAKFIRKRYGWKYGIPAYAAASLVAYTRVEGGQHYAGDVIAGAGIGILSSYLFARPYEGWSVQVTGDTKNIGLQFTRNF